MIRSYLSRHQPITATSDDELLALHGRAWRERGYVAIRIDEIRDPWLRQGMTHEMERRYGKRIEHAGSRG